MNSILRNLITKTTKTHQLHAKIYYQVSTPKLKSSNEKEAQLILIKISKMTYSERQIYMEQLIKVVK